MRAIVTDEKTIVDNKVTVVRTFDGPEALGDAEAFIETLPEHEEGRYGIDACILHEAHCDGCDCFATAAEDIIRGFNEEIDGYMYGRFGD